MVIWVMKIFSYSFSVYSCHLFLISSAPVKSIQFLSFILPIFVWNIPWVSLIFLKRSLVFPILTVFLYFFALITSKSFLMSPCYSLEFCNSDGYLSFSPLPFPSLVSQLFVGPPQTTILPFCISFSWGWFWSPLPVQCYSFFFFCFIINSSTIKKKLCGLAERYFYWTRVNSDFIFWDYFN